MSVQGAGVGESGAEDGPRPSGADGAREGRGAVVLPTRAQRRREREAAETAGVADAGSRVTGAGFGTGVDVPAARDGDGAVLGAGGAAATETADVTGGGASGGTSTARPFPTRAERQRALDAARPAGAGSAGEGDGGAPGSSILDAAGGGVAADPSVDAPPRTVLGPTRAERARAHLAATGQAERTSRGEEGRAPALDHVPDGPGTAAVAPSGRVREGETTAGGARGRARRPRWALPLVLVTVLALVGAVATLAVVHFRGDGNGQSAASPFDAVTVTGRVGATPTLSLAAPVRVQETLHETLVPGDGRTLTAEGPVLLAVTAFDASDGSILNASGRPRLIMGGLDDATIDEELREGVLGVTEGSRVVFLREVADLPDGPGVEIDVVDVLPLVAHGTERSENNAGPLVVTMTEEAPVIDHGSEVPTSLTTQVLVSGDGPQVREGDRVVVQYVVKGWTDGVVRHSTWESGRAELLDLDEAMPGVSQAIIDLRVGSRVAITVPADLATGDDTLCVLVDVLGTEPSPDGADG